MKSNQRIAELNDALRRTGLGGKIMMTASIAGLPDCERVSIVNAVRNFSEFSADNDPYGEHCFGALDHGDTRCFWKIDYYDADLIYGSEDPADPSKTTRVLTIMQACEY